MTLNIDAKLEGKLTFAFKNNGRNLGDFHQSTSKSQNQVEDVSLKFTGDLLVMAIKNDAKLEEELTCRFKTDMRNLTNIGLSPQKSQKFNELFFIKVYNP